jgi:serine/threonine protein kinase
VCEVLRIGMQTAKGLAAAHAQGLIHRDVKPSNILLDEGVDRALLTDFGLARATDDASLTRSGFHPGTPHYMSPEQVRGESIDARSDLFGLGCVLYALCTGHPPFRSETSYAVLRRITDDTPRPIRETNASIPEWLERIVMKLLAKSREDRYASAIEVHTLLEKCLAHVQQPTTVELPVELQIKAKSPKWLVSLAVMSVCIAIGCGVWSFNNRPTEIGDNAASAQTETVSITAEPQLQWESDKAELESLRQDFVPIELKTKKLWDIEPAENSFNDKP